MNLYSSLEIEFKQPFEEVGLDFKNEYTNALVSFNGFEMTVDEKYDAIREVLLAILNEYSNTKPTTKVGRFGRFMSRIGAVLLKVIKFKI
jgi:hypothetical protein